MSGITPQFISEVCIAPSVAKREKAPKTRDDELNRLKEEAYAQALSEVSVKLQGPHQLEKIEMYRRKAEHQQLTLENSLKRAVQSQLHSVQDGMKQLKTAIGSSNVVVRNIEEIDKAYEPISKLTNRLAKLHEESSRNTELSVAVDNMKNLYTVPDTVAMANEHIEMSRFLQAHKLLASLEVSRDSLLFQLHRLDRKAEYQTVEVYFSAVAKLAQKLAGKMWMVLSRTLVTVQQQPQELVSCLRIIEREQRFDDDASRLEADAGFRAPGRPRRWRDRCLRVLEEAVCNRIESSHIESQGTNDRMWLVKNLERMKMFVLQDIRIIKVYCEDCFPPSYNIVQTFVQWYHKAISQKLAEIIGSGDLDEKEIFHILVFVQKVYRSSEMMGYFHFKIDLDVLPPLLDASAISQLESRHLADVERDLNVYFPNALDQDFKSWVTTDTEQKPPDDEFGCYQTPLPPDIIAMFHQFTDVAMEMGDKMSVEVVKRCLSALLNFTSLYKQRLEDYTRRHLETRTSPQPAYPLYLFYMIAQANNCDNIIRYTDEYVEKQLKDGVDGMSFFDRRDRIREDFTKLADDCLGKLLNELYIDISEHVGQLLKTNWLTSADDVQSIMMTVDDYNDDFVALKTHFHTKLMDQLMNSLLQYYFERLTAGGGKLKPSFKADDRRRVAERLEEDYRIIEPRFVKYLGDSVKDKLQFLHVSAALFRSDKEMVHFELKELVRLVKTISQEELASLLTLRGDFKSSEAREFAEASGAIDKSTATFMSVRWTLPTLDNIHIPLLR